MVSDEQLNELRTEGFTVVASLLAPEELSAAQACLWQQYPTPSLYFADPAAYPQYARSQFAGLRTFPFRGWELNRLAFHPELVDAAERYLGTNDIELYKAELWAKYAGAVDYEQPHHRDFGNHSIVVPREDGWRPQLTSFILLSDVTHADGPTAIVSTRHTAHIPMGHAAQETRRFSLPTGSFAETEVKVTGAAGTAFIYRTDVFHRGTDFTEPGRSRFALLADFQMRGNPWAGKVSWGNQALQPGWVEVMERATVRERDLFGFPQPGSPYWNHQTLTDVQLRYPQIDITPYRAR